MSRKFIFSLLSLSLVTACALPGGLPLPNDKQVPNPTQLPNSIPSDQADNLPIKPITGPTDQILTSSFGGKIAYLSNRDQPADHTGTGSVENIYALPETQVISPYIYQNGNSRRLGSYTVKSAENISMGFLPNGKEIGYLVPEKDSEKRTLFTQSLNFIDLNSDGFPIGQKIESTLPVYQKSISPPSALWGISSRGELAVIKADDTGKTDIWVGNADGSNLVQVTRTESPSASSFQEIDEVLWSPDGKYLYYTLNLIGQIPEGMQPYKKLVRIERNGANPFEYAIPFPVRQIQVSPTGNQVLFTGTEPNQTRPVDHLYTIHVNGTNLKALTIGRAGSHYYGKWSPEGKQIVFVNNTKTNSSLCTSPSVMFPPSSPEERQAGERLQACLDAGEEIATVDYDASNFKLITRNEAQDTYPTWSPDGKFLAFTSKRDGNLEIYVMQGDGSKQVNISKNASDDSRPVWAS